MSASPISRLSTRGRKLSVSLLQRVVLALCFVGLLPFLVSFHQIRTSREAMVSQTQATHLVAAKAAADRVAAYLELLRGLGAAIAVHPEISADPGSAAAAEALRSFVWVRPDLVAAGLYVLEETPTLIQLARRPEDREVVARVLRENDPQALAATRSDGELFLRLRIPLPDERLGLLFVARARELTEDFVPVELGEEAELVLAGTGGEVVVGDADTLDGLSPEALAAALRLRSGVAEYEMASGEKTVCAYASVAGSPWFVLSRQPSRIAESAATAMRRSAWQAFGGVLAAVVLLAAGAHATIVKPIRRLAKAQRQLAGTGQLPAKGGEIAELEASFALLERNLHDREALAEVFLGRYQVVDVLGAGAMGTVFRGWDPRLQRHVALKTIKLGIDRGDKRDALAGSLRREAVTLARLQHPHIVTVFDILEQGSVAFIAMELIEGVTLGRYIWRHKALAAEQVIPLGAAMFKALAAAHQQGIVHRDIKPGNVLLGHGGAIKVTDFGISELLSKAALGAGKIVGTIGFLAPETLRGNGYTEKSDLFATGVVLYESLTGHQPFQGKTAKERIRATLKGKTTPLKESEHTVPPQLESVMMRLLSRNPDKRPESAAAVAEELDNLARQLGCRWRPEIRTRKVESAGAQLAEAT